MNITTPVDFVIVTTLEEECEAVLERPELVVPGIPSTPRGMAGYRDGNL